MADVDELVDRARTAISRARTLTRNWRAEEIERHAGETSQLAVERGGLARAQSRARWAALLHQTGSEDQDARHAAAVEAVDGAYAARQRVRRGLSRPHGPGAQPRQEAADAVGAVFGRSLMPSTSPRRFTTAAERRTSPDGSSSGSWANASTAHRLRAAPSAGPPRTDWALTRPAGGASGLEEAPPAPDEPPFTVPHPSPGPGPALSHCMGLPRCSRMSGRLRDLHEQQAHTLQQLLNLRQEQLRLRQQQLGALACLLRTETAGVTSGGIQGLDDDPHLAQMQPLIEQTVGLLSSCLEEVHSAVASLRTAGGGQALTLSRGANAADSRAEEASNVARALLVILRGHAERRAATVAEALGASAVPGGQAGLSADAIANIPSLRVPADLEGFLSDGGEPEVCSVCIAEYSAGDACRKLPCQHVFHLGCIDAWLGISSCCPVCRSAAT